jgi:hypothetical protein
VRLEYSLASLPNCRCLEGLSRCCRSVDLLPLARWHSDHLEHHHPAAIVRLVDVSATLTRRINAQHTLPLSQAIRSTLRQPI